MIGYSLYLYLPYNTLQRAVPSYDLQSSQMCSMGNFHLEPLSVIGNRTKIK